MTVGRAVRHPDRDAPAGDHEAQHRSLPQPAAGPGYVLQRLQLTLTVEWQHAALVAACHGKKAITAANGDACSCWHRLLRACLQDSHLIGTESWQPRTQSTLSGRSGSSCSCSTVAWRTRLTSPSTGAPLWAPCWPMRRSSTGAQSVGTTLSSGSPCARSLFLCLQRAPCVKPGAQVLAMTEDQHAQCTST